MPKNTTKKTYVEVSEESKVQMIEVVDRELFIFGKQISRHPKFPWLFSITDVYKACEPAIKNVAIKKEEDPSKAFINRRPGVWTQRQVTEEKIASTAAFVRHRIKKHGASCGFGKVNARLECIEALADRDICMSSSKGGSSKAATYGTYVCQDFLLSYAGFLHEKFQAKMLDSFISVLNGYTKEVTKEVERNEKKAKGTPEREEDIKNGNRLREQCARLNVQYRPIQGEITRGALGMYKREYMEKNNIKEPFNDNASLKVFISLLHGRLEAVRRFSTEEAGTITLKKAKSIGYEAGVVGRYMTQNADAILKAALADEAKRGKRA